MAKLLIQAGIFVAGATFGVIGKTVLPLKKKKKTDEDNKKKG